MATICLRCPNCTSVSVFNPRADVGSRFHKTLDGPISAEWWMMSSSGRRGRDGGEEAVCPESQISSALCLLRIFGSRVTSSYYTDGIVWWFFFWWGRLFDPWSGQDVNSKKRKMPFIGALMVNNQKQEAPPAARRCAHFKWPGVFSAVLLFLKGWRFNIWREIKIRCE